MKVIGITGGIGSGKSIVARVLRCNGFNVYDCDSEAKRLMTNDPHLKSSLIKELGWDIYLNDGQLNKQKLSNLLFSDDRVRNFVNHNVHSAVRRDIREKVNTGTDYFFIESAILATGGITSMCDEIWVIKSPETERIRRVESRDGLKKEEIERRISAQQQEFSLLPVDKMRIIENDIHTSLLNQIFNFLKKGDENIKINYFSLIKEMEIIENQ